MLLTKEERSAVTEFVGKQYGPFETFFTYSVYILPTLAFAIYGLWNRDFAATLVAYGALLTVAVLYLSYALSRAKFLQSAIKKCMESCEESQEYADRSNLKSL